MSENNPNLGGRAEGGGRGRWGGLHIRTVKQGLICHSSLLYCFSICPSRRCQLNKNMMGKKSFFWYLYMKKGKGVDRGAVFFLENIFCEQ